MRVDARFLRKFIENALAEARFTARAPKRFGLPTIEIDGGDTNEAGRNASDAWFQQTGKYVDPLTVDLDLLQSVQQIRNPGGLQLDLQDLLHDEISEVLDSAYVVYQKSALQKLEQAARDLGLDFTDREIADALDLLFGAHGESMDMVIKDAAERMIDFAPINDAIADGLRANSGKMKP